MARPYQQIEAVPQQGAYCVRLLHQEFDEDALDELSAEIARLIDEEGCRRMVLVLGPRDPDILFSVFLAKLVNLKRRLESSGGGLALAQVSSDTHKIFEVAGLAKYFQFYDTVEQALASLGNRKSN